MKRIVATVAILVAGVLGEVFLFDSFFRNIGHVETAMRNPDWSPFSAVSSMMSVGMLSVALWPAIALIVVGIWIGPFVRFIKSLFATPASR